MIAISVNIIYFFIYSFLGWVQEILYFLVTERRFRNGGIVIAPLLPIYGIGALSILLFLQPYIHNPFLVFLLSAILASVIEYIGHYAMEKWFHVLLWDYKDKPFNLNGRICLENSLGFGILALFVVYVAHPFIASIVGMIPQKLIVLLAIILGVLFIIDVANAWMSMIKLRIAAKDKATTLPDMKLKLDEQIAALRQHRQELHKKFASVSLVMLSLHRKTVKRLDRNFRNAKIVSNKKRSPKNKV